MTVKRTGGSIVQLEDGIFMIPARKKEGCNIYVLKGLEKIALIDVGMSGDHDFLCSSLAEIGLTIADVSIVVLTHEHIDHVGGVQSLPKNIVVAAHARAACKLQYNDQFSMMSGAFGTGKISAHVDIHLENGSLIDLGGLRLKTIYTPGHCSGAICLFEPSRGALFTADTIFAGGILGGIFASGNISDYINSLDRLSELKLEAIYPGHGPKSTRPTEDLERAIKGSSMLLSDTRDLFDSIKVGGSFDRIKRATVDYSRRAAERREDKRIPCHIAALVHLDEADHPVSVQNISLVGARLDRKIPAEKGSIVLLTLDSIGDLDCEVIAHIGSLTRLSIRKSSPDLKQLLAWLLEKRNAQDLSNSKA